MISEVLAILAVILLTGLLLLKAYNLIQSGQLYSQQISLLGAAVATIFWIMLFFSLISSVTSQQNYEITNTTGTTTVQGADNSYIESSLFLQLGNFLFLFNIILTVGEVFVSLANQVTRRGKPFHS